MAVITNYSTLVENIQGILENDDTEFVAYIPAAISLAEDRIIRENDFIELEFKQTGTIGADIETVNKPSGVNAVNYFFITVAGKKRFLKRRTDSFLIDYWPDSTIKEVPKYYTDDSETQYKVAPTPDATYSYEIKFSRAPGKLSITNSTNYFISNCPDLLFKACLVEMVKFMKAWTQIQIFEGDYQTARESWNLEQARKRRDNNSVPMNPEGSQNTLKHTINTNS